VSMGAQQIHQPAIFRGLGDICASGVTASERSYSVQRLHKIGVDPGTVSRRSRETQPSIRRIGRIIYWRGFAAIKKDFKVLHRPIQPQRSRAAAKNLLTAEGAENAEEKQGGVREWDYLL